MLLDNRATNASSQGISFILLPLRSLSKMFLLHYNGKVKPKISMRKIILFIYIIPHD